MKESLKEYKKVLLKEKEENRQVVIDKVFADWDKEDLLMNNKDIYYNATRHTNNEYLLKMNLINRDKKVLGLETFYDLYVYLNSDSLDEKNNLKNKYKKEKEKNIVKLVK